MSPLSLRRRQTLKQLFSTLLVLLFLTLGLLGIYVSLFPPSGARPAISTTLLGIVFSSLFLAIAWLIRRWAKHCLLCK